MTRGLVLAALLAARPASAQEASGPRRAAGNAPVVAPIVMPSLPVTPAASNASVLTDLLRRAAASALGLASQAAPIGPTALGFAPGRDGMAPPVLPNSAMEASQGLAPKASAPAQGLAPKKVSASSALTASGSQSSSTQQNRQTQGGRLPDVLPITIEATQNMPAISRGGESIGEKAQALKVPFEAASGLATAGQGRGDAERARGLGDGIWDVMTNQNPNSRGGLSDKDNLRDSLNAGAGAPGMGGAAGAAGGMTGGRNAPDFEALLDYSALSSGNPGSGAGSAVGAGAGAGTVSPNGELAAGNAEFFAEALDAAETARRFAREELKASAAKDVRAFSGPVAKLWLDTLDSVVRILTLGGANSKLKPTWSAEAGDSRPASRYAGLAAKAPAEALDVPLLAAAPGAAGPSGSTRLVTRLASKSGLDQTPAPSKGFIDPAAKSVPDALLVLSLLPLLAVALGYLREFRS